MFKNVIFQIQGIYIFLIVLAIAIIIGLIAFLIHRFLRLRLKENEKPNEEDILKEEMNRFLTPIDDEKVAKQIEDYKEEEEVTDKDEKK